MIPNHKTALRKLLKSSPRAKLALLDRLVATNFMYFLRLVLETIEPGKAFHLNWHIAAMAHALDRVRRGERRRLIMTLPPRHLKTIITSVAWPAYLLGLNPRLKVICASYALSVAVKSANDFRSVLRSEWYQRAFPDTRIGNKDTETDVTTTQGGGRYTTAVEASLTGRGADILIGDDLMDPAQAHSTAEREANKRWLETTFLPRLNDKATGAIVVVQQRLHAEDPVGVLLEKGGWDLLDIPAIADQEESIPLYGGGVHRRHIGDVLDETREPREVLENTKVQHGSAAFSAQYLQRPVPADGDLLKRSWLKTYDHPPAPRHDDFFVISLDTAFQAANGADYTVATIWQVKGEYCYLLDVVRERIEFPGLLRLVRALRDRLPQASILIEDKGSGMSLIQQLRDQNIAVIAIKATEDKRTRLITCQPMFEAGSVLFPKGAPWLDALMSELLAFPNSRHDDQVDSISQALTWIRQRRARQQNEAPLFICQVYRSHTNTNGVIKRWPAAMNEWDSDDWL